MFSGKGNIMKIGGKFSFAHGLYYPPAVEKGGGIDEYRRKSRERQSKEEEGKYFAPFKAYVYEESPSGAYQFNDFETTDFHEAVKWAKEEIANTRKYRKDADKLWATVSQFVPIEERENEIYAYSEVARFNEEDTQNMKYATGGAMSSDSKGFYIVLADGSKKKYDVNYVTEIPNVYFAMGTIGIDKGTPMVHHDNVLTSVFYANGTAVEPMPQYAGKDYWDFKNKMATGGNTTFYYDQAKKTLGEHLYNHIASLNKEQLEIHLSHLQKEIERMKANDTEFTKQEFLPKYKQEEKFILYLLERLDEYKYADGGNVEEDQDYYRVFRNNAGKDVAVKIVKNPIFGKYDYYVDGTLRGQFETFKQAREEVNYENFDMYKRGGRLDDETRYEQLKNDIIKQSDYYEKGDGLNSRFRGAKNKAGDEANGEYTIEGNTILWTYTDKQGRDYNSSEMPSFTVNLTNTNVRLADGGNIYSKEESLQIARTILQQMGGQNRLVAFTGAYGFAYADGDVSFRIKNRKVNYVKVKLNGKDLYDVTFGRVSGTNFKVVEQLDDVYAEDLIDIFEKSTGMYLRFEKGGRMARGGGIGDIKVGDKLFIEGVEYIFISREKAESKIAPNHIEYYFSPVYAKNKPLVVDFRNDEDFKAWLKNKKYAKGGGIGELLPNTFIYNENDKEFKILEIDNDKVLVHPTDYDKRHTRFFSKQDILQKIKDKKWSLERKFVPQKKDFVVGDDVFCFGFYGNWEDFNLVNLDDLPRLLSTPYRKKGKIVSANNGLYTVKLNNSDFEFEFRQENLKSKFTKSKYATVGGGISGFSKGGSIEEINQGDYFINTETETKFYIVKIDREDKNYPFYVIKSNPNDLPEVISERDFQRYLKAGLFEKTKYATGGSVGKLNGANYTLSETEKKNLTNYLIELGIPKNLIKIPTSLPASSYYGFLFRVTLSDGEMFGIGFSSLSVQVNGSVGSNGNKPELFIEISGKTKGEKKQIIKDSYYVELSSDFSSVKKMSKGGGIESYINIDKMSSDEYKVVTDFRTLKSLAKNGLIELDEKTGLRYKNYQKKDRYRENRVTNVRKDYIKSAISPNFEFNNKKYAIGYIKGLNFLELYVLENITNNKMEKGGGIEEDYIIMYFDDESETGKTYEIGGKKFDNQSDAKDFARSKGYSTEINEFHYGTAYAKGGGVGNINKWEKGDITIVNGEYLKRAEVVPSYKDDTMRGNYFVVFRDKNKKIIESKDNFEVYSDALRYAMENVNKEDKYNKKMAKGGLVVTSIKDIPNFKEENEAGRITYRGLGMGKLSNDFHKIAGEGGTRIKVKGKEYYITDSEFNTFSRDSSGKMRIKFDAPHRRFEKGGIFNSEFYKDGGEVGINFKTDTDYVKRENIKLVKYKNGKELYNWEYWYGSDADQKDEVLSGLYVAKKPFTDESQYSMFKEESKLPEDALYIERSDIDSVIIYDEKLDDEVEIPANRIVNGISFDNTRTQMLVDRAIKEGLLPKPKEAKNSKK
jgi:hypothetical protein